MSSERTCHRITLTAPTALIVAAVLAACAANPPPTTTAPSQAVAAARGEADKLLVVDCLLPGQIRKLGSALTYLTPRRPIKTSALDCEIRGGEYVAYDRADYATALKVWLPPAQEGDPAAQTYVGEIYEKGFGVAPDYGLAAQWYRKAAERGYSRAQINLGFLYEKGLGVPKDTTQALNLYRQASGLTTDQLAFTSSIEALESQRRDLEREVDLRRQEAASLRRELGQMRGQLESRQARLKAAERELEQTRRELERVKRAPGGAPDSEAVRTLEQRLAQQQVKFDQQRREIAYLQRQSERQQAQMSAELGASKAREQALRQDVAARAGESESLREQVASLQGQVDARRAALDTAQQELEQARQALEQARSESAGDARIASLEQSLADKQAQIERQDQEMAALQERQARLDAELQATQADVDHQARERDSLQQQVDYLQGKVFAAHDELKAREQELEAQRASLLEQQRQEKDAELARMRQQITQMETELKKRQEELDKTPQPSVVATRSGGSGGAKTAAEPALPSLSFGRYHALIIGNNRYSALPSLETAVNDAQTVARILKDRYGFQTQLLVDADRRTILTELNKLRAQLTDKDNFLLYYAGHGELDRKNAKGHWLPVDAEPTDTTNWISNEAITDILNAMNAKHVLVIADSCYSGALARAITTSIEGGRSDDKLQEWFKLMIDTRSRTVLTSGGVKPVLDSGGGEHSIFAKALLDILRNNEQILESPVLYLEVARRVKAAAARLKVEQDPRYAPIKFAGDLGAPFFFVPAT